MAKSASTARRTSLIKLGLKASQGHSFTRVTYIDDNSVEQNFNDAKYPITITKRGKPPIYANTNYNPAAADAQFSVINKNGVYSPKNTASGLSGIFVRDRVFKFYDGKRLEELSSTVQTVNFDMTSAHTFYTTESGGSIILDESNSDGNSDDYFQDLFALYYDASTYDSGTYTPAGYFVATIDRSFSHIERWNSFTVNCASIGHAVYYRTGIEQEEMEFSKTSASWTLAGYTTGGSDTFTINVERSAVIQIAVIYDGITWAEDVTTTASLSLQSYVEWILLGSFFLDDPDFRDRPGAKISVTNVTGRNAWKRALETKINLQSVNGSYLDDVIKEVCDQANISYTASSIADLSSFGARNLTDGYGDQVDVSEIFEDINDIIGATYRMYISDENVLFVTLRGTSYLTDTVLNFKNYLTADQGNQSDKQIQRITFFSSKQVLDETIILGSNTFYTAGDHEISWANDAIAKYWETPTDSVGGGGLTITNVEFDDSNKKAIFTLTGTGSLTITVKGNEFSSTVPDYYGEAVNVTNMENNNGRRFQVENKLLKSMTEAKAASEAKRDEFGTPDFNVKVLTSYLHPLEEINDQSLWVSEDLFDDSIFQIISIEHIIQSEVSKKTQFELLDTGRKFTDQGAIVWNRDYFGTAPAWQFDTGIFYDSKYRIGVTRAEILAQTTYKRNVDFN